LIPDVPFELKAEVMNFNWNLSYSMQDPVKKTAGHIEVEEYLKSLGFGSWSTFRPQYMTGDGNNKDCEEWFFDSE
jgi:hypothetical protein